MTKSNLKAAWLKELHEGEANSIWRNGAEIVDEEMQSARKLLDKAKMPFTMRDLVRLTKVLFKSPGPAISLATLAKTRLDCEGIPYTANDFVEMIALLAEGMDFVYDIDAEEDNELCDDCAREVRH